MCQINALYLRPLEEEQLPDAAEVDLRDLQSGERRRIDKSGVISLRRPKIDFSPLFQLSILMVFIKVITYI